MEQRFQKWDGWVEPIYEEIQGILIHRHVFKEVQEIIKANPKIQKPSSFYQFIGNAYAALGVMAVRRQVKIQKDSISLAGLLSEMIETPELITKERYLGLFTSGVSPFGIAEKEFERIWGGSVREHIDPALVQADLDNLKSKARAVEEFADRKVAHLDKRSINGTTSNVPTYGELSECLDLLEELVKKYYLLFRAASVSSILPTWQYDWKAIFYEPWIPVEDE